MRPVARGPSPRIFKDYGDAAEPLKGRLGRYCSYCEKNIDNIPAVEHVLPRKHHPTLTNNWENFLLACVMCNSIKGFQDVDRLKYCFPDDDNTFLAFQYDEGGRVNVNHHLASPQQEIASRTIELLGLDRYPGHPKITRKDDRALIRREVWDIAVVAKEDLARNRNQELMRSVVETMKGKGFWSVWMTVFRDDREMRRRFIDALAGTHQGSFDTDTQPVPRGKI